MIGIYCIKNQVNDKKYIGQSIHLAERLSWHRQALNRGDHHNKHLQNAWNKYGENSFEFDVVCECDEDQLDEYERNYIHENKTTDERYGYNEESGGNKHKHLSERTKAKISAKTKGVNNPMYGVHLVVTDETRQKLSDAQSGTNNGFYGKHHTEESKRRMSEAKRGRKVSIDIILKKGQNKKVRCLNNAMEFDTLSFAAQWAEDTAPESISRVCYGKQHTAGTDPVTGERLKWEFIELSHTAQ